MPTVIVCTGIISLFVASWKWRKSGRKAPFVGTAALYAAALSISVWSALDLPIPSVAVWISRAFRPIADSVYGWLKS